MLFVVCCLLLQIGRIDKSLPSMLLFEGPPKEKYW
jgi:hypothetical protein